MLYRLESVRKSFGTKDVLKDATWQHDPGRVVGLVGRNGAGKSTVLRIVLGTMEPDGGRRLVAGGTTFASLDQAVEPEGDEPLRAFVARAQEDLVRFEPGEHTVVVYFWPQGKERPERPGAYSWRFRAGA